MTDRQGLATRSIHGTSLKDAHGAPHLPIYNTTTFAFENTAALLDVVDGRKSGALYTRYGLNPTTFALEETMAAVEGAETALPRPASARGRSPYPVASDVPQGVRLTGRDIAR